MLNLLLRTISHKCFPFIVGIFAFSQNALAMNDDELLENNRVRIHGSNTVGEKFAPLLVKAYLDQHELYLSTSNLDVPKIERVIVAENVQSKSRMVVELFAHGSSTGFRDLLNQTTDIAMSSRRIKTKEKRELAKIYPSILDSSTEHVIAYDGLAITVHPENPIERLSMLELAKIYAGEVTNWKELGGLDQPIAIYARDDNSGTFDTFKSLVLKAFDRALDDSAKRFESSKALVSHIVKEKNAIGFVGASHTASAKVLAIGKTPADKGILPNRYTIGTEDYALSRRLYLYLPKEIENPMAHQFVEFVESNAGQKLAADANLISYYPTLSRPLVRGPHLKKKYKNLATIGQRLSITFRLKENGIDSRAERDLRRLMSFNQYNPHKKIVLAGFWDDGESTNPDLAQASHWMSVLRHSLSAAKIEPWLVEGGFFPIENSDSPTGRSINRRVEVWVL